MTTEDMTTALGRPSPVNPIRRRTLTSQVTEQLRDGIHRGVFLPGTQLHETELAERLGVSRGPVRESLQRLIQEGLLASQPHRGVFVPVLSEDDVVDVFFAREAVEAAAFRRVITARASAELLDALRRVVDDMATAAEDDNWWGVADLDLSFHRMVVEAAGSHRLNRMFDTLVSETRLCLNMYADLEPDRMDLLPEHRGLVDLIAGADLPTALTTLRQHFDEAVVTLRRRLRQSATADGGTQQRKR
ncbi:GntR family transcriptional regulator [Streptomyces sp. NBC_01803]|uniref:GntR family transcriptional regulator n=1 Tax=Streptomyces sp. NBC_01803 TaxID=2975946 RepID=UPI002DDC398B|nr:GntR family transcriptional regulator [Streptomyces sp. NBC_01803]WSA43367.1 GntR family transcriptional regulator [Streptomyces sp. NBC_01803]